MNANNISNWCDFLVSIPTCHGSSLDRSHIARGGTTVPLPDETELKRRCLAASRNCVWLVVGLKTNPCGILSNTHAHTYILRGEFLCVGIFFPSTGNIGGADRIGEPVDDTLSLSVIADCKVMRQMPWPKSSTLDRRPVYTQQNSDDMSKRAKPSRSYSKSKLKAASKPNEIYNFPVNAKWIHSRLLC